jgi:hypothetical protein
MSNRRPAAAVVLLAAGLSACDAGGQDAEQPAAAPSSPATVPCRPTDLSKIRADKTNRVDPRALNAEDRSGLKDGRDATSYVARVNATDLAAAGLNAGFVPRDHQVLLFVNHGNWGQYDFAYSRGLDSDAPPTGTLPLPAIAWALSVVDPATHQTIQTQTSPADACFTE